MSIKRRFQDENEQVEPSDDDLMEKLIKQSIKVNPTIKDGRSTQAVIDDFRQQAAALTKKGGVETMPKIMPSTSAKTESAVAGLSERRLTTIKFFFEQKVEEFDVEQKDILIRERELQKDKDTLRFKFIAALADFFSLMAGGAESPEARKIMRDFSGFLQALGVSESDIVRKTRERST
jgi:hypothetical protein